MIQRRHLIAAGLYAALPLSAARAASPTAATHGWKPSSRVEFVVPSGPGAALDGAARKLTDVLAQQQAAPSFVVTNRSSAHGLLALNVLQQHAGDPHYLMSLSSSLVYSDVQRALPLPYTEFTPLALLFNEYTVVAVRADSPLRSGPDLIAALGKDAGALSIGIATTLGNHIHLGVAKPLRAGGVDIRKLRVVPYKSSAESVSALLGGHLDVVSATTPNLVAHLAAGRVRVLAVGSPQRLDGVYAGVPTWREQGVDALGQSVQGVMTGPGVNAEQQRYWTEALRRATESPGWRELLARNQWQANFLTGPQAAAHLARERQEVAQLLTELDLLPH